MTALRVVQGRQLPSDDAAENAILGAILCHPKCLAEVLDLVTTADFFHPSRAAIYQAMVTLDAKRHPSDAIAVAEQMRVDDTLAKLRHLGGEEYLVGLMTAVVSVENIAYHAKLVAECARRRRAMEAADGLKAAAWQGDDEWDDRGGGLVFQALQQRRIESVETSLAIAKRVSRDVDERVERFRKGEATIVGARTGLDELDRLLLGLKPGRTHVIAARPSRGKTSLATQAVARAAIDEHLPGYVASLETSRDVMFGRMLLSEAEIDSQAFARGDLDSRQVIRLTAALSRLANAPITIDDEGSPSLQTLRARVRRWRSQQSADEQRAPALLVVDYLQLMEHGKGKGETLTEAIGRTSRGLKTLAKDCGLILLVLSQLNRSSERDGRRPNMSDLRDSGAIEADADVILFLHVPKAKEERPTMEIIVGKNKEGPCGSVEVLFDKPCLRFRNLSRRDGDAVGESPPYWAPDQPPPPGPDWRDPDDGGTP